jgi:hypothetical protein
MGPQRSHGGWAKSHYLYLSGWWYTYPSEKYEFVSWDDDIASIWKNKNHVPNHHQPKYIV